MTLNPLANPKGTQRLCELCQKPAFIKCSKCKVTFYCGVEHQRVDWVGIHSKICQLLIPLRMTMPFLSSDEERAHRDKQLKYREMQMIELTRTTGQKLLFEGKHEQAVPAALQCLRFSSKVHGLSSIELVPSYLILGEASIGLGKLSEAERYLSQANWTVLKMDKCDKSIKSKLHRNIGLLHAAKGNYKEALNDLAYDVYYASEEFGTEDIRTSGGYFHMANVFFKLAQMQVANSLYDQVLNMWYDHLLQAVEIRVSTPCNVRVTGPTEEDLLDAEAGGLDEAQEAEAVQVLNAIYEMRQEQDDKGTGMKAKTAHALAMLHFLMHDIAKAKEYGAEAMAACEDKPDEDYAKEIVEFMKICSKPTIKKLIANM